MTLKEFCIQEGVTRVASSSNGSLTLYSTGNTIVGWVRGNGVQATSDEEALSTFASIVNWNCRVTGQNINVTAPVVERGESVLDYLKA